MKKEPHRIILSVQNFSFSYEASPVIQNVSFSIYEKDMVLVIGASGSGKSSLALCLNGLYPQAVEGSSSGTISFQGENVETFPRGALNQRIGIVFQDPDSQFCMITVEDELAFTLENRKISPTEMLARIREALAFVGMDGFEHRKIHELSGGQKQKIALASVLLLEPELLILDEPTANLDPVSRLEFIQLIQHIQEKQGLTVMIIEHQIEDWIDITNRVIAMNKHGQMIADGRTDTVFAEHKELLLKEGIFLPKSFSAHSVQQKSNVAHLPSSDEEILFSLKDVSFHRNRNIVLNKVDLNIHRGEFLAIAGENGAGKSTLLQLMAGLLTPIKGSISFLHKDLKKWDENNLRKRMGFVFQNPEHQFITDTVYDEIAFGMKLNNYSKEQIQTTAHTLMEQFHLKAHQYHNPFSLSGGQKRRLSVATMLDETPDILFFDEPTFGQDAHTTEEFMDIIHRLRKNGTTIVFVTHDMDIVDEMTRVIVLHEKDIIFNGLPKQLWTHETILKKARLRLPYRLRQYHQGDAIYDFIR